MSELTGFLTLVLGRAIDPMLIVIAGLGGLSVRRWPWAILVGLVCGLLQVLTIRKLMGLDISHAHVLASLCAGVLLASLAFAIKRWLERRKSGT